MQNSMQFTLVEEEMHLLEIIDCYSEFMVCLYDCVDLYTTHLSATICALCFHT